MRTTFPGEDCQAIIRLHFNLASAPSAMPVNNNVMGARKP
jgi:hypothetical protein